MRARVSQARRRGLAAGGVLGAVLLAGPGSAWAGGSGSLVWPAERARVELGADVSPWKTGDPVGFQVSGWWCFEGSLLARLETSDVSALPLEPTTTAAEQLRKLVVLGKRAAAAGPGDSAAKTAYRESEIALYALGWRKAFGLPAGPSNVSSISVPIPPPGKTASRELERCYGERELEEAWQKIRKWYIEEARRRAREKP